MSVKCNDCGRFHNPTEIGASGRQIYSSTYWQGLSDTHYRCKKCTDKLGKPTPCVGCAESTTWINKD